MPAPRKLLRKKKKIHRKVWITTGPSLWVAMLLQNKGIMSSNRIWEEYQRDTKEKVGELQTKNYLKNNILPAMLRMGKIAKARAPDIPQYKYSGWKVELKSFKNVPLSVIKTLDPPPMLDRRDVREWLMDAGHIKTVEVYVKESYYTREGKHLHNLYFSDENTVTTYIIF